MAGALLLSEGAALGQYNQPWTAFQPAPQALPSGATISDDQNETDLDWADLDLDGDIDLVIVRKEPFTTTGGRTNVLLMNEAGVLVDRTLAFASTSDVVGDQGFLALTNDRDVVITDLTGDGYPEIVTATEQSPGQPKSISHPRVYLNKGSQGGVWQGFVYEESRIPAFLHFGSGLVGTPRLAAVDAADLDGDGDVDLYFGDHDTGTSLFGALEPPSEDLEDRLLINDGSGFFTDATVMSLTMASAQSGFCNSVELADFNQDGFVDIAKQATYQSPEVLSISYNDPTSPGLFGAPQIGTPLAPYFINSGDLNQDGRLDLAVTSNADDYVLINEGNGAGGHVNWSVPVPLTLIGENEPDSFFGLSYSSNNLIVDIDGDGWQDLIVADVDVEVAQYQSDYRLHLYHNRGGTPGTSAVELVEERQSPASSTWVGAPGLLPDDVRWTHDVAVFDIDGDGLNDLVLSRREGTQVWLQTSPPVCQNDLGFGTGLVLEVCGGDLSTGSDATLSLFAAAPSSSVLLAIAATSNPTPLPSLGITVLPFPPLSILTLFTDATGQLTAPVPGGGGPATLVIQAFQPASIGPPFVASNAIEVQLLP